jgi:leucyl/phenylalanyl-tRNA---protein transferase
MNATHTPLSDQASQARRSEAKTAVVNKPIYCLASKRIADALPPAEEALEEPEGLLAVGGDLAPERLVDAYRSGIFPWYSDGQPILWWSPDPRMVLVPRELRVSRSLRRALTRNTLDITCDKAFAEVLAACAAPRPAQGGTWLTDEMQAAYRTLAAHGYAHSVEAWSGEELVGGLYGLSIGRVFFGESMFTRRTDASKIAFVHLVERLKAADFALVDCQVHTDHLASLGARPMPRSGFLALLVRQCALPPRFDPWTCWAVT